MYRMHHYPAHVSTNKLSGGTSYPWYPTTKLNTSTPQAALGAMWELQSDDLIGGGNAFMVVRAGENLAQGDVVGYELPAASTVTASGSDTQTIVTGGGSLTVNAEVGNWLHIRNTTSSGGGPVLRKILSNTATTITISGKDPNSPSGAADVDKLTLAATNGDMTNIIRPWRVKKITATGGAGPWTPVGVVLGTVTAGNYTIIQVAGMGFANVLGQTTAAAAIGRLLICSATAGTLTGANATATLINGGAIFMALAVVDSATAILTPVQFNCLANL